MASRVFCAHVFQETHFFNPLPTTMDDFVVYRGEEVWTSHGARPSELNGTIQAAARYGWKLHMALSAFGGAGGRLSRSCFDDFLRTIGDELREHGPFDGIVLALHGSMAAEGIDDAEAAILRHVRAIVGDAIPLALTLDMHGNVSPEMCRLANIVTTFRTNPHVDFVETALRACALLERAMTEGVRYETTLVKAPMLYGFDRGRTLNPDGPMAQALALAQRTAQDEPDIATVEVFAGYAYQDWPCVGPTVTVTARGDAERFLPQIREIMAISWSRRGQETERLLSIDEAVEVIRQRRSGKQPVFLADWTDTPLGGGPADSTNFLAGLLRAGSRRVAFVGIRDPDSALKAAAAGVGATVSLRLGGKTVPHIGGGPLEVSAKVLHVSEGAYVETGPKNPGRRGSFGLSALVDIDGIAVAVCSRIKYVVDIAQLRVLNIEPSDYDAVVVKDQYPYRVGFAPYASEFHSVDAGGIFTYRNFRDLGYERVPRPCWPLDPETQP